MSETRRDRWGCYPGGGIVNRGGTCEHTDSLDDAMARLEQSLALSDELVGSIARRTVTAVADHRDVPAAAAHVMLQQENSGYPVFEVTL